MVWIVHGSRPANIRKSNEQQAEYTVKPRRRRNKNWRRRDGQAHRCGSGDGNTCCTPPARFVLRCHPSSKRRTLHGVWMGGTQQRKNHDRGYRSTSEMVFFLMFWRGWPWVYRAWKKKEKEITERLARRANTTTYLLLLFLWIAALVVTATAAERVRNVANACKSSDRRRWHVLAWCSGTRHVCSANVVDVRARNDCDGLVVGLLLLRLRLSLPPLMRPPPPGTPMSPLSCGLPATGPFKRLSRPVAKVVLLLDLWPRPSPSKTIGRPYIRLLIFCNVPSVIGERAIRSKEDTKIDGRSRITEWEGGEVCSHDVV